MAIIAVSLADIAVVGSADVGRLSMYNRNNSAPKNKALDTTALTG